MGRGVLVGLCALADAAAGAAGVPVGSLCEAQVVLAQGAGEEACAVRDAFTVWGVARGVAVSPVLVPVVALHDGVRALQWAATLTFIV